MLSSYQKYCLQSHVQHAGFNTILLTGFDVAAGRRFTPQLAGKQATGVTRRRGQHRMALS